MAETLKVVGNLVSKNGVTLFLQDGSSMVLDSVIYNVKGVLGAILPQLAEGNIPVEIDLDIFAVGKSVKDLGVENVKDDGVVVVETKNGKIETEALKHVVANAAINGDAKNIKAFMEIMKKETRKIAAEEMLAFINYGKLQIADDGSIIAYKKLVKSGDGANYVDPHTRKVVQNVGALVFMPKTKVDDNHRNLCSTGLHVGNPAYFSSYGYAEENIFVVKIKPNDVVAIGDNGKKMRVCAYHIVAKLPSELMKLVNGSAQDPFENEAFAKFMNPILSGNHTVITQRVEVGASGEFKSETLQVAKPIKEVKVKERKFGTKANTVSPKEARKIVQQANKDAASPFQTHLAEAKKILRTKKGRENFSLRAFCKERGISRTTLTKYLKEAGLL
jgi:hypothetical protein